MKVNFENAEKLFDDSFCEASLIIFEAIALDEQGNLELRAESYNMMEVIVQTAAPYLSEIYINSLDRYVSKM